MNYAFWQTDGTLVDATEVSGGTILGPLKKMMVPFLKEGPLLLKIGSRLLFEVSPSLGFADLPNGPVGQDATTIWQLELLRIVEVPHFEMPPEAELTTTASGLKYKILVEGDGPSPKMYEYVTCNYSGWLTNGTLFDSSFVKGHPAEFLLGKVVQGWNEGLQLMKAGGSAILVVPPDRKRAQLLDSTRGPDPRRQGAEVDQ
jgi:FKBP-type peptidyl-prolyl cis-trans isomerase